MIQSNGGIASVAQQRYPDIVAPCDCVLHEEVAGRLAVDAIPVDEAIYSAAFDVERSTVSERNAVADASLGVNGQAPQYHGIRRPDAYLYPVSGSSRDARIHTRRRL